MTAFDDALEDLHADQDLAVPADHRQGGQGPAARIRVGHTILEPSRAPFGQALKTRIDQVQVRIADVPALAPNDTLTFDPDGTPWVAVITTREIDAEGLTWLCQARRG